MPNVYEYIEKGVAAGLPPEELARIPEMFWQRVAEPQLRQQGLGTDEITKVRSSFDPDAKYYVDQALRGANRPNALTEMKGVDEAMIQPADIVSGVATVPKLAGKLALGVGKKLPFVGRAVEAAENALRGTAPNPLTSSVTAGFNSGAGTLNAPPSSVISSFLNLLRAGAATGAQLAKPAVTSAAPEIQRAVTPSMY